MGGWRGFFDTRRRVQVVALALAVCAAAFLLVTPMYSGESTSTTSEGTTTTTGTTATLAQANGSWVIGLLLVPVALMAVHAFWVGRGRTAAIVACTVPVAVLAFLGLLTIGVFLLPAVIVSGISLLVPARTPAAPVPTAPPAAPPTPA